MGKEVRAINDERPNPELDFLGVSEIFEIDIDMTEYHPDMIISLDAASLSQL